MSKKIIYWTGFLEPEKEAISKEVFLLSRHHPKAVIGGLSKYYFIKFSLKHKYLGLHFRFFPLMKILTWMFESFFEINHIFSDANEWFFLNLPHQRPLILTCISGKPSQPLSYYNHLKRIVVENERDFDAWVSYGFNRDRLKLIYPAVPEAHGSLKPQILSAGKKFRILFASSPPDISEIEGRGFSLMRNLLEKETSIEITYLTRPWKSQSEIKNRILSCELTNFKIMSQTVKSMEALYMRYHAVIVPYKTGVGKSTPLSALECLMAGRPVLMSNQVPISHFLEKLGVAVLFDPESELSLKEACQYLRNHYVEFQSKAKKNAIEYFSIDKYRHEYDVLYNEVLAEKK